MTYTSQSGQGQFNNNHRLCQYCSLEKIENEQHFLLECPLHNTLRHDFIEKVESHHSNLCNKKLYYDLYNPDRSEPIQ
jgi:hypothetical protein